MPTFSVTGVGNAAVTTGNCVITVGAAGVPAGALIIAIGADASSNTTGSIADSASNTYTGTGALNGFLTNGNSNIFYVKNCNALSNTNTITYTRNTGTTTAASMSVMYATGADATNPYDSATRNTATKAANTTITVTSNTTTASGDLYVYACAVEGGATTANVGTGWSYPPGNASTTGLLFFGGNQIGTGANTVTASPSWSGVKKSQIIVLGFKLATAATGNFFLLF